MLDNNLITQLTNNAKPYPSIKKIVLFGSRARKNAHPTSDYDICLYCNNETEFTKYYFDTEDIDTIYKVDVLRYEAITNEVLKKEIEHDGVVIYECGS
ncbi:MAG: nucleotidyltransferase domain-containing protein [Defluviitaleaceae bacterium]|nr:nucleotidyltransferase domain-containing protein [Defluviitaleaceae bacterium]